MTVSTKFKLTIFLSQFVTFVLPCLKVFAACKLSGAPTVSCRIDEKIRCYHKAREGHEEPKRTLEKRSVFNMIFFSFVIFVTFVVRKWFVE